MADARLFAQQQRSELFFCLSSCQRERCRLEQARLIEYCGFMIRLNSGYHCDSFGASLEIHSLGPIFLSINQSSIKKPFM